jgi:transcriptional antiterminator
VGRNFLSGVFLIFCFACLPLWGTREGEEPPDHLELLEKFVLMTISTWNDNSPAFIKARIMEEFQNESNPLLPEEFKKEGWEYIQERLGMVRAKFLRSIEEVDSLIRLIQVIIDTPRSEGVLDFEADDHRLLVALRDHLINTIPRPRELTGY